MISEVQIAEIVARLVHAIQIEESTGDPYIEHVERVAAMVSDAAKPAAWLHDVLEDSELLSTQLKAAGISRETILAVALLTRIPGETYSEHYIPRIKDSGNPLAIEVKLADLKDHLRPNCPPRLRPRYVAAWRMLTGEDPPSLEAAKGGSGSQGEGTV